MPKIRRYRKFKRHDKALKVIAVQWSGEKGILPEGTKWWMNNENKER